MKRPWAFWRRLIYGVGFIMFWLALGVVIYAMYFTVEPTCFDNRQNGNERGIDCGGSCSRICELDVVAPQVAWARSFRVVDGQYNAVAYIENKNRLAASPEVSYTFSLYDQNGLITQRSGKTILPPDSVYPVFESRIDTAGRIPTQTFLEIDNASIWVPSDEGSNQFSVQSRSLQRADEAPRLEAVLYNTALTEAEQVEVIATIFDANGNALTASRTFIDNFAPRSEQTVVFTWPEPIAKTVRSCEIPTDVMLAVDVSGSMNNDQDEPPQPITSVLEAAQAFAKRLQNEDQAGLVRFASESALVQNLTLDRAEIAEAISALSIDAQEESGSTNTGSALQQATDELVSERHNSEARKVLVLLTDGLATSPDPSPGEYAVEKATAAKENDITIYTIGLGEQVQMEFLETLASAPSQAYQALTASDVNAIYQSVTADICEDGAAVIQIVAKSATSFSGGTE